MQKLLEGIEKFRKEDFKAYRELFKDLKKGQAPHTLFISCSDSRIDSHLITETLPGELFVIRNIANMVPPFRETTEYVATRSAIEYAVIELGVENIIVCGHSHCGGCAACLDPSKLPEELVHTKKWLELAHPVRDRVLKEIPEEEPETRARVMEQSNVVQQLKHLVTYPYIQQKVAEGKLALGGWYYIIETGEIFIYDKDAGEFVLP
ncbi:MAG TPA: carbonic anhydrase [Clostridia bacterium]|nr:carbonic anhydrase [Clostridia bacterium]